MVWLLALPSALDALASAAIGKKESHDAGEKGGENVAIEQVVGEENSYSVPEGARDTSSNERGAVAP